MEVPGPGIESKLQQHQILIPLCQGQGWNPYLHSNPSCCGDNAGSLTCCFTVETPQMWLLIAGGRSSTPSPSSWFGIANLHDKRKMGSRQNLQSSESPLWRFYFDLFSSFSFPQLFVVDSLPPRTHTMVLRFFPSPLGCSHLHRPRHFKPKKYPVLRVESGGFSRNKSG